MSQPIGTCTNCGRHARLYRRGRCHSCNTSAVTKDDALTGGRWVLDRRRRVLIWEVVA